VPNIVLGAAGLALLAWRARDSERSVALRLPPRVSAWLERLTTGPDAAATSAPSAPGRPVVVIRIPVLNIPRPRLLDIYLLRRYFTVVTLAFTGLLGLFYIGTVIDLSEKVFKGNASSAMLLDYLFYGTPKFIYLLMPLAVLIAALVTVGTFSRTGELTVMRSCGVSLYRLTVPLVLVAAVWSVALFAMEERVMAEANRRQQVLDDQIRQRPSVILDVFDRHWVAGTNGRIYFYRLYDQRQRQFADLSIYQISAEPYRVVQHTFVASAAATRRGWAGGPGWSQAFPADRPGALRPFDRRTLALDDARLFETEDRDAQAMTVSQLGRYVKTLKEGGLNSGSFQVELHRKLAMPLMTIVMTLLAVPFGVTTGRRGALYGIGLAIALSFAYQAAFVAFGFFGAAELLPAVLAAWAPNLLFLAGASYLLLTART
jgi:LPS export ABC transporter permease LptG